MRVSVVLIFAIRVSIVSGKLAILKGREQTPTFGHSSRKLICVSEDDDGGLIWNSNLNWMYGPYEFSDRGGNTNFRRLKTYAKGQIDCDLNSYDECMSAWYMHGWNLTSSKLTPMGPVFDRRWEDFGEQNNFAGLNEYRLTDQLEKSGAFAMSVRGSTDAHLLLCDTEYFENDFCYWIIIGGWNNRKSAIRKCANGVPNAPTIPAEPACKQIRATYFSEVLSPTEWRTFVLVWSEETRSISVYDTKKFLMTYKDDEEKPRNQTRDYKLFLRSPKTMLFRFHIYRFLHTTDSTATLVSPEFDLTGRNLCVQMIIGLCNQCRMEVALIDSSNEDKEAILDTITGSTVMGAHGLAMWQYLRINETISANIGRRARIKLIPSLEQRTPNPLWAIANVRACSPVGAVRGGSMEATPDYGASGYFWPNVTCQKLFYNDHAVVNSALDVTFDSEFDDLYCADGTVGPYCSINCYNHLRNDPNCKGTVICEQNGCTCPPGFMGSDCDSNCEIGRYGHGCTRTCGWCRGNDCDFKTGHCTTGCDNSKRYNIPPFCKAGIDVLPPPTIDFVNETVVRAIVPVMDEYKLVTTGYRFVIQKEGKTDSRYIGIYTKVLNNATKMIAYADDLVSGTSYQISCILYVNDQTAIPGRWTNFTTRCKPATNFLVEAKNTSLTLTRHRETGPYPCPDKWYDLLFQNVKTRVEIYRGRLFDLPHEFKNLEPCTIYEITITKGAAILFSREIQTLDGVPSPVRNISISLFPNLNVTLKWDPPLHSNGKLTKYEIVLQLRRYLGCQNRQIQPRKNDTNSTSTPSTRIAFSNLKPYANYTAKIAACTSYCGPEETIEFSTHQTETPSEKFTNLRIQGYTLMWNLPKDCTTISGTIAARIVVNGVSNAVSNFSIIRQTTKRSIDLTDSLYGVETYEAKAYAIRAYHKRHNELIYEKLVFVTPPKAPPPINNLEIFEIDLLGTMLQLRWQEPKPPINGKIEYYVVNVCTQGCVVVLKVQPREYCKLWSKYVCATIEWADRGFPSVTVSAKNENVTTLGDPKSVQIIRDEIRPDASEIVSAEVLDKGIVNFTWAHPWRSGGRLTKFQITIELISSRLRTNIHRSQRTTFHEHPIDRYRPLYNEKLRLLSSSTYKITVRAITNTGIHGQEDTVEVQTPTCMGFEKNFTSEVHEASSTISLHIPNVLNDTRKSLTTVVVTGTKACKHRVQLDSYFSEKMAIERYGNVLRSFWFPTEQYAGKTFTIDYKPNNDATDCPLTPEESYAIAIVVQSDEESIDDQTLVQTTSIRIGAVSKRHEAWLIPITIILVAGTVAFYLYRRRRRSRSLKEIILQGETSPACNDDNLELNSSLSSSKQPLPAMPTSSNKELLSAGTPRDEIAVCVNDIVSKEERSSLVKVKDFEDYVKLAIQSGLLEAQYNSLPRGQTRPWDYGKLPENKSKNRYGDLVAYDENRVTLKKLPDDPFSDYINASYIKGYKKEKCYIATQGPKANTVIDFWRMIWQEEVLIICMLANLTEAGKIKCEQYWPDIGKKKKYGDIIVFNARHTVFADYTYRTLHVSYGDEARKIEHLHYTTWPDHGVPLSTHSIARYMKKLLATPSGSGPIVVHCSAGAGRTGTIILCDVCLRKIADGGAIDVFAEVKSIRSQRANMVDNNQQYRLAHLTLVECLFAISTSVPCDEHLPTKVTELKKQLHAQRDNLENMTWREQALRSSPGQTKLSERNLAKHRYPELASGNFNRVFLKRYPVTNEDSDYIAAVYVDSVRSQNQYLATQLPLPGTFSDFWRMVAEYKIELIVLVQPPDTNDTTCCPIIPGEEFKPVPYINVRSKEFIEYESYTSQTLTLADNSEKPVTEQQITILCSTAWRCGRDQDPPATGMLINLWQAAEKIARGGGPTAVLCHDGVTGCGLYLALSFLLERMAVERECDVCLAIRTIRRSRADFVKSLKHMEYLYDAAITYLGYFETYANFS